MHTKLFKVILSVAMAFCLAVPFSSVCFAEDCAEPVTPVTTVPMTESSDSAMQSNVLSEARSGVIYGPVYGTTTGFVAGSFDVPYSTVVNAHWKCTPVNGANGSAIFKMTVTGNGVTRTVYLDASNTANIYSVGALDAGKYEYRIESYTNVSGEYFYGIQFYAY